jgi:hypothetical protein
MIIESILTGTTQASLGKTAWDATDGAFYSQTKLGWRLDPSAPTTGQAIRFTIEKRLLGGANGVPAKLQTWVDGTLTAETAVGWDPRLMGPASSASTLNGAPLTGLAPKANGAVDGLGGTVGNWQVTGPGESLAMFEQLDPLGHIQTESANGVGSTLAYSAGPDASTLKTSVSRLSAKGAIPEADELETAGTTGAVCK